MKQSSLYTMKIFFIEKLFGGHDEAYAQLHTYVKVVCETDSESKAYCSFVETKSISIVYCDFYIIYFNV